MRRRDAIPVTDDANIPAVFVPSACMRGRDKGKESETMPTVKQQNGAGIVLSVGRQCNAAQAARSSSLRSNLRPHTLHLVSQFQRPRVPDRTVAAVRVVTYRFLPYLRYLTLKKK